MIDASIPVITPVWLARFVSSPSKNAPNIGPYTSDATTIKIGPLGATRKACATPAGVDEQEAQFFAGVRSLVGGRWELTAVRVRPMTPAAVERYLETLQR